MTIFSYEMSDTEAIKLIKQALLSIPVAILQDKGISLVAGGPGITAKVTCQNGKCITEGKLLGKMMKATVSSKIEMIAGFKKQ